MPLATHPLLIDSTLAPAGSWLITTTPVAVSGPLLVTVSA
jgi:hypothetical protein